MAKSQHEQDALVSQLKQEIIFGRLRPRERLVEDELTAKFGASRHQIRGAFAELEKLGLVIRRPNKGVVVRDYSAEEIEHFFEVGALLQAEAARRIPLPLDGETMKRIEQVHGRFCAAVDRLDFEVVSETTIAFHRVIAEASNNKCLSDVIQQIWTATLAVRCYAMAIPEQMVRIRHEHSQILEALRTGNRRELIRLCVDHSWPALDAYKRLHGGWAARAAHSENDSVQARSAKPRRKRA
jgi:DNA-binding GntR family transcriptional regulator